MNMQTESCSTTCSAAGNCGSVHASVREIASFLDSQGIRTFLQRNEEQGSCRHGELGVCCTLCPDGPCRIRPNVPQGRCGIDADGIAARNLLRLVNQGGAAYTHDFKHSVATLRAAARGEGGFGIRDAGKLAWLAGLLGVATQEDGAPVPPSSLGLQVADALAAEFRKDLHQPLSLVENLVPASRRAAWAALGVLPGGYLYEAHEASAKVMPNIDTDYVDLSLTAVRLAISAGFLGNIATSVVRDIVLGCPDLTAGEADLGVLDPATVNIILHGHVPWMGAVLARLAKEERFQARARAAGSQGIKVYGSLCTGQELAQRPATACHLDGQVGNWLSQEFVAATGLADLFVMEKNCSAPGLPAVIEQLKLHTRLVPVNPAVRLRGVAADAELSYTPERAEAQAERLIAQAIEAYGQRNPAYRPPLPTRKTPFIAGFGVESVLKALGGSPQPLLDAIGNGTIKGVVGLVSCVTAKTGAGSFLTKFLAELLAQDVLVLVAGCASSTAQIEGFMNSAAVERYAGPGLQQLCGALGIPPALNFGSCLDTGRMAHLILALADYLQVDPSKLPVVAAAPEYYNNDALIDGLLTVSLGINTYVNPPPPVTGAADLTRLLTADLEGLLGARFLVESDPVLAAGKVVDALLARH